MKLDMEKGAALYQYATQQLVKKIAQEQKLQKMTDGADPIFVAHGLAMELAKFIENLLPGSHMYEGVVLMVNAIGSAILHLGEIREEQKGKVNIPSTEEMVDEICSLFCAGLSTGMAVAEGLKKEAKKDKKLIIH